MEVGNNPNNPPSPGELVAKHVSDAFLPLTLMVHDLASKIQEDEANKYRINHIVRMMHVYNAVISMSEIVDKKNEGMLDQSEFDELTGNAFRKMLDEIEDPECDGTDFASPSWWRGHEQACETSCRIFEKWIDEPIREPAYGGECFNRAYKKLAALKAQALGSQTAVSPGCSSTGVLALDLD
jgi:hypothetical protein